MAWGVTNLWRKRSVFPMIKGDLILGIDLGTTNSVMAILEGEEPVVIPNAEGALKTPSVVCLEADGTVVVGEMARRQAATRPDRTVSSIKRLIGHYFSEIDESTANLPYTVEADEKDDVRVRAGNVVMSPEEISAEILRKLKNDAEGYLGQPVTSAIITVPAYFDDRQRSATKEAGRLAGLDVLRLINEPTAAAMAYGLGRGTGGVTAIYDFGGGTFDLTVLDISERTFEVLATEGDSQLGGDDLDRAIVQMIVDEFYAKYGVDLTTDPAVLHRLKEASEKAKCELSTVRQATISLPFLTEINGQTINYERALSRTELEDLIEPFIERSIAICERVLDSRRLKASDVEKVILVGGTTRIPLVQQMVEEFFDRQPFRGVNPDEIVALGAAVQAGVLAGNLDEVVLLDVTPHSLGIETRDNGYSVIVERNTTIPIKKAKTFTTTETNQEFVNIHVLQGENGMANENLSLGKFTLKGIEHAPAGHPRIRVTFQINADGIVEITAQDLASGSERNLTISHAYLSADERRARDKNKQSVSGAPKRIRGRRKAAANSGESMNKRRIGVAAPMVNRPGAGSTGVNSPGVRRADLSDSQDAPMPLPAGAGDTPGFAVLDDSQGNALRMTPPPVPPSLAHRAPGSVPARPTDGVVSVTSTLHRQPPLPSSEALPQPPSVVEARFLEAAGATDGLLPRRAMAADTPPSQVTSPPRAATPNAGAVPAVPAAAPASAPSPKAPAQPAEDAPGMWSPRELVEDLKRESSAVRQNPAQTAANKRVPTQVEVKLCPPGEMGDSLEHAITLLDQGKDDPASLTAYSDVLPRLVQLSQVYEYDPNLHRYAAMIFIHKGLPEQALDHLQKLDRSPASVTAETIRLLSKVIERHPSFSDARRKRAQLYEADGRYEGAIKDLEFVLANESNDQEIMRQLEQVYEKMLDSRYSASAELKLIKILLRQNKIDEAIRRLQNVVEDPQYRERAQKVLGFCYWQKQMYYPAFQQFKNLPVNDEIRDVLYRLGNDLDASGDPARGLEVLEFLQQKSPDYLDARDRMSALQQRVQAMRQAPGAQGDSSPDGRRGDAPNNPSNALRGSRFVILEELNRGSMGVVFKARDTTLDEIVALKVLNDFLCSDPMAIERFKREARAAKKLSHHRIVRINDLFEISDKKLISMEYIDGRDLKRILMEQKRLDKPTLRSYVMQIGEGLEYAHKRGVIHRDIKPANIMITSDTHEVKITDFGIAKNLQSDDMTTGSRILGTPLYMAPEQIEGKAVDARSDIYALGIMMYEMVTGTPPFCEGNIEYQHIHMDPPPMPANVDSGLAAIILKAVQKKKEDRFRNVRDLMDALAGI